MGLDTTHGCWHGPYSAFMRYREKLVALAWGPDPLRGNIYNYRGFHDPESHHKHEITSVEPLEFPADDPLTILIDHSDCDGEILPEQARALADRLEELMKKRMPNRALYDELAPATARWITGLRAAAAAGESVGFH